MHAPAASSGAQAKPTQAKPVDSVTSVQPSNNESSAASTIKKPTAGGFKSFSIKAAAKGELKKETKANDKVTEEQDSAGNQRAVITNEKLNEAWLEFSKIHSKDKVMLSQIMEQHKPVLNPDGESYVVTVFNEFQNMKIKEVAPDLATFLRAKLQNSHLRMKVQVDESKDDKQFFTTTDKLKLMVETNPDLNLLRKTFGLDLE